MKMLDAGITDLVTVFMKVMVKRRMRGSTRSQSEKSTFKIVCQGDHGFSPSTKAWPCRKCLGWMEIDFTTGKVSPQEPTLDKDCRVLQQLWPSLKYPQRILSQTFKV